MHPFNALPDWLPDCDFGVMDHGFLPHGRDYSFLVEVSMGKNPGRYQVQLTHVVEFAHTTAVAEDHWRKSWGDAFLDYQSWVDAGEPEGYVWGTCWSLAWPGVSAKEPSPRASSWAARLGHPMYEAEIATDRFRINLVFHSLRWTKVSDETSVVSRVVLPLSGEGS
jgi:hypothetical protein